MPVGSYNTANQHNYLFGWTATIRSKMLLEVRYGMNHGGGSDTETFPNAIPGQAGYLDVGTGKDYGWWRNDRVNNLRDANILRTAFSESLSGWGGRHDLKVGFENERDPFRETLYYANSLEQILNNAKPFEVTFYNAPYSDARQVTRYTGYIQDQWSTNKNVTINAGVRYDRSEGWTPQQTYGVPVQGAAGFYQGNEWFPAVTFPEKRNIVNPVGVAPRVGVTWDIGGQHKWVTRFNYGRWYDRLLSVPTVAGGSATYLWSDKNGDGIFQGGEQTSLVSSSIITDPNWNPSTFADPNRKNPYTDSYQVGLDWEVYKGTALSVVGTYKVDKDIIGSLSQVLPYSDYDTYTATNKLTGQPFTLYLLDPAYRTVTQKAWSTNPPGLHRSYKGLEVVLRKRFDQRLQFQVSTDVGRAAGNVGTNFGASTNFANPNSLINADGPTDVDATIVLKAQGTYVAPRGILLSGTFLYNSGYPMDLPTTVGPPGSPLVRYVRGVDYPATAIEPLIDIPGQPRGSVRQDRQVHNVGTCATDLRPRAPGTYGRNVRRL